MVMSFGKIENRDGHRKKAAQKAYERKVYYFFKRLLDLAISCTACILLLLPSLFIMLMIRVDSTGPAIYRQERLGKDGKPFLIYKFRSMRTDAEADGPRWAQQNDSRCTSLGAFLRKWRIDEWPQFINILKGDMSLVGPRPERACFYESLSETIPTFPNRLCVKPGLTGYAQVFGGLTLKAQDKLRFDLEYISKSNFWLDLQCILKTFTLLCSLAGQHDAR